LVARRGGRFPADAAAVRELPGVGDYTAGAVGSLALGLPLPLVDGKVARVLARLFAVPGDPRRGAAARRIRALAAALVPAREAGAWNEGLMELGGLVCVPRRPRCPYCPQRDGCEARARGLEERIPAVPRRRPARAVRLAAALVRDGRGRTLLLRRPDGGLLGGLYELPAAEVGEGDDAAAALSGALRARLGGRWRIGALRARVRHSILDRRIALEAYDARPEGRGRTPAPGRPGVRYAAAADLAALPLSSLVTKALAADRGPVPLRPLRGKW
jgi:A/G-specific adenine glycosylase